MAWTDSIPTVGDDVSDDIAKIAANFAYIKVHNISQSAGATIPTGLAANSFWLKSTTAPMVLYFYDGTDSIQVGTINSTTNIFVPGVYTSDYTAAAGYRKAPDGFIYQWGTATTDAAGEAAIVFAPAFPNAVMSVDAIQSNAGLPTVVACVSTISAAGATIYVAKIADGLGAAANIRWKAVGH